MIATMNSVWLLTVLMCTTCVFVSGQELVEDGDESYVIFSAKKQGYDNYADIDYKNDKAINKEYSRVNYQSTKVRLAGPDSIKPAKDPFAVGQRSFDPSGTMMDRWDVKDTEHGVQYYALFHGIKETHAVNWLRSSQLRDLTKYLTYRVKRLVPEIKSGFGSTKKEEDLIRSVNGTIHSNVVRMDTEMCDSDPKKRERVDAPKKWSLGQESRAVGTIVVVSELHVITINVGPGKVIAYQKDNTIVNLTPEAEFVDRKNYYGDEFAPEGFIKERVKILPRANMKFIVLETPSVAKILPDDAIKQILDSQPEPANDNQEIYSDTIKRIFDQIEKSRSESEADSDYSVMLVGLNSD